VAAFVPTGLPIRVAFTVLIGILLVNPERGRRVMRAQAAPTAAPFPTRGDEFLGPFPSWTNLKTAYRAVGNGVADDTTAIQKGLTDLGTAGHLGVRGVHLLGRLKPNITDTHARAALEATKTIPIVFTAAGDPVATGLVSSLARPGANATGVSIVTTELVSKRLDLLHQLAPRARGVVFLANFANPATAMSIGPLRASARALGIKLETLDVRHGEAVANALRSATWKSADAAIIGGDIYFIGEGARIAQAVRDAKMPAIFPWREYHTFGAVMSYGVDLTGVFRRAAYFVDRILKGAKPSDLPVEQVSTFDLIIDLRVAREMGIKVPQELLFRADQVIR
jgi:putative ABC transport system substrate-binding protein